MNREIAAQTVRIKTLAAAVRQIRMEVHSLNQQIDQMRDVITAQKTMLKAILGVSAVLTPVLSALIIEAIKAVWR